MRARTTRLGRWRGRIREVTKLVDELVRLMESLTTLTSTAVRFVGALTALSVSVLVLIAALR